MLDLSQRANNSATLALETATDVELIQQSMDQGLLPKLDTLTTNLETADLPTAIQQGVHNRGMSRNFHWKGEGGPKVFSSKNQRKYVFDDKNVGICHGRPIYFVFLNLLGYVNYNCGILVIYSYVIVLFMSKIR